VYALGIATQSWQGLLRMLLVLLLMLLMLLMLWC
jgi:hypothetical protein